jgi:type IV secretion system protein VirD4
VTAEYFSARSGDMSVTIKSTMTVRQTMAVAQMIPQYRETQGQGRRRLLTPDEVLRLPNTDLLCVIRGCNMLRLKKLDYTGHRMSKELQHCSILDYTPVIHVPRKTEPSLSPLTESDFSAVSVSSDNNNKSNTTAKGSTTKKKREKLYSSSKPPQNF